MTTQVEHYGPQSFNDEPDSYERNPFLPQHHAESLRSRRRHDAVSQTFQKNNDDGDLDSRGIYPDTIPASGTISSDLASNGRPGMTKIKSIARIGRSTSISVADESFGDETKINVKEENESPFYFDDTNDFSWECSFGTTERDGIWMNRGDPPGIVMAVIVWILIVYSGVTIAFLAQNGHLSHGLAYLYCTICAMALASHAKTSFSDPGAVPSCAVPIGSAARKHELHTMCGVCKSYKPPFSHHCRICNRCVSRMDHHCPWMNNCIGAANLKSFILFLFYTWVGSAFALMIFGCNYFLCREKSCEFDGVLIQLVRVMTVMCTASILFVSSMLANVVFGVITGSGTIDRLKSQVANMKEEADHPSLEFEEVFGIGPAFTWFLPTEPIFPDHDKVLGFSVPQRLLREGNENTSVG